MTELLNLLCLSNSHFAHPDPHLPYPPSCRSPYEHIFLQSLHACDLAVFTLLSLAYHSGVTVLLCTAGLTLPSLRSILLCIWTTFSLLCHPPMGSQVQSGSWLSWDCNDYGISNVDRVHLSAAAEQMQSLFLLCPRAPNRIEHIKEIKTKAAWRILTRLPSPPVTLFPGHGKARHQLVSKIQFTLQRLSDNRRHWLCSNDRWYGNSKGKNANRLIVKLNPQFGIPYN